MLSLILTCLLISPGVPDGEPTHFQLIDQTSLDPLRNRSVQVTITGWPEPRHWDTETDGHGGLRLPVTLDELPFREITFRARGMAPAEWRVSKTPIFTDRLTVPLAPGRSGGGRIVNRRGHAIPGAAVYLRMDGGRLLHLDISGSTGAWSSAELPPEVTADAIRVRHAAFGAALDTYGHPLDQDFLTVLDEPQITTVKIVDSHGQSIEGVRLTIGDETFWTAGNGEASVSFSPNTAAEVIGERSGFRPFVASLRELRSAPGTMTPCQPIRLSITSARGEPIANALVRVANWSGLRPLNWRGRTDSKGVVMLNSVPPGEFTLQLLHPAYISREIQMTEDFGTSGSFVLRRPFILSGNLAAEESSPPPVLSSVEAVRMVDGYLQPLPVVHREQTERSYLVAIDADDPPEMVRFTADGYRKEVIPIPPGAAVTRDHRADLLLKIAETIAGRLIDPQGRALPGVALTLGSPLDPVLFGNRTLVQSHASHLTLTDDQGAFRMARCPEHPVLAAAAAGGFIHRETSHWQNEEALELQPWNSIRGMVQRGPYAAESFEVTLAPLEPTAILLAPAAYAQPITHEDTFHFHAVPDGKFIILCRSTATSSHAAAQVQTAHGESLAVTVQIGMRRIAGSIKWSELESLEGARFPLLLKSAQNEFVRFTCEMQPDGSFELLDVPPGNYEMELHAHARPEEPGGGHRCLGIATTILSVPEYSGEWQAGTLELTFPAVR